MVTPGTNFNELELVEGVRIIQVPALTSWGRGVFVGANFNWLGVWRVCGYSRY